MRWSQEASRLTDQSGTRNKRGEELAAGLVPWVGVGRFDLNANT